jgi:hypothetical protein
MTIRRKFICDLVEQYKRNNAEEYGKFLDVIEYRRSQLSDQKLAKIKGITEVRLAFSIPSKLSDQLFHFLNGVSEERFLDAKGEMKWFCKQFPEFLIPNSL